ncbi:hypothetical protein ATE84_1902 [Aquimarina sp. MAR_2010_214]|uniref:hypothetical protein n=1 Tax=Aquimarina sp. MAR_2010_214 TaxID=1250026 RepID=UPI000C70E877|nr:hypothetical protein [Aquimarina sp. MAR_2010_214]PKV49864.1 hypothetical protein ATE84_1902 [Aquimarina sp. MAR_2010_214]
MKKININTYITTFVLLFVLATICSLIGYANNEGTLVFTPTTEFLLKLHSIVNLPTNTIGYPELVKGVYGVIGGLALNVMLYSLVFERFVFCLKALKRSVSKTKKITIKEKQAILLIEK